MLILNLIILAISFLILFTPADVFSEEFERTSDDTLLIDNKPYRLFDKYETIRLANDLSQCRKDKQILTICEEKARLYEVNQDRYELITKRQDQLIESLRKEKQVHFWQTPAFHFTVGFVAGAVVIQINERIW